MLVSLQGYVLKMISVIVCSLQAQLLKPSQQQLTDARSDGATQCSEDMYASSDLHLVGNEIRCTMGALVEDLANLRKTLNSLLRHSYVSSMSM